VLAFLAVGAAASPGEDTAPKVVVDQKTKFEGLKKEFDDANRDFTKAYQSAKSDEERKAAFAARPNPDTFADRFLAVAADDAKSDVAAKCYAWVVQNVRKPDVQSNALEALLADHLASPVVAGVCQSLLYSSAPKRDEFLRAVLDKSSDHDAQGQACYSLAFGLLRRGDAKAAEPLFERVVKDFADVKYGRISLGEKAKGDLFETRSLSIGKTAPDVVGADVDGKPMKLSDYRGKVVVLDFFGFW
jgi:hypothetical protein